MLGLILSLFHSAVLAIKKKASLTGKWGERCGKYVRLRKTDTACFLIHKENERTKNYLGQCHNKCTAVLSHCTG